MFKAYFFPFVVVFCVNACVLTANEVSTTDVSIAPPKILDFIIVHTAEVSELHTNGSELEVARAEVSCSEEEPCRNGGTCSKKMCTSLPGTFGVLSEEPFQCSDCVNRLEVDCLYDYYKRSSYCSCKNSSLYYDYDRDICIPCPCGNGYCDYEITYFSRKLKCNCYSGYKEFLGYCKECDCGPGQDCELDSNGEKICHCIEGYYEREGRCYYCDCHSGAKTTCEVTGNEKNCFCEKGYQSVLGHCEDINECETNNTCHPTATCHNTYGSFKCYCPEGYRGSHDDNTVKPGEICEDINECKEELDTCYIKYARCVNVPGSFKCECQPGYEPDSYKVQPRVTSCLEYRKSSVPTLIVVFTSCAVLGVAYIMHAYVKKRAARSS